MIKEYRPNTLIALIALLGSSMAHSGPGATEKPGYADNIRKVAILSEDVIQPPETAESYRHKDSFPITLGMKSNGRPARINVKFKSIDGPASSMYPRFKVTNDDDTDLNLDELVLHYWFNCDCATTTTEFKSAVDWAGLMPSGLSITSRLSVSFEPSITGNQTHMMVVRFVNGSPSLPPGQSVEIHARFNRKDWGNMPPMNDWSYAPFNTYTGWNRIAGYVNGSRVWGEEP
ncbi:MAG TPA: cellulose binding domain-containing protein [Gammaproteobacteria bacterium]